MADQEGDMTPDPTSTITASGHGILGFWQNKKKKITHSFILRY